MPDDNDPEEPFSQWAERWLQRRASRVGEYDAVPLTRGPRRGAHVNPNEPRVIVQWDGYQWQPVSVAGSYAEAQRFLNPPPRVTAPPPEAPMPKPKGRHRKPPARSD
ncbi:DUF6087 family protein [Streptomyces roseolus]|uniref:DUF6087 family protein n=1 Tax=Streptomyces roseolus TaxID=67358 RepID=UPI00379BE950